MDKICAILPYPSKISVNRCWKIGRKGIYLDMLVKNYRNEVYYIFHKMKKFENSKVRIEIGMFPPDDRVRDIDNILKVLLDALQHAGVYNNDNQVTQLYIEKKEKVKDGKLEISIENVHNEK